MPTFTEVYPIIIISKNSGASAINCNFTGRFDGDELINAKPTTAGPCGESLNTLPSVATPPSQTGQSTVYKTGDDGTFQAGRLNKTSPYSTPAIASGIALYTSFYGTGQFSGTHSLTWGLSGGPLTISNNVQVMPKLGLMFNADALERGESFAWDQGLFNNDIFAYLGAVNTAGVSGYSDWRIANLNECMSYCMFFHPSGSADIIFPAARGIGFTALTDNMYTGTTAVAASTFAYTLLSDGTIGSRTKTSASSAFAPLLVREITQDTKL